MSGKPCGQGRKPGLSQARVMQARASDNQMALLVRPTGQPRPEWMADASKLPRKPPSKPELWPDGHPFWRNSNMCEGTGSIPPQGLQCAGCLGCLPPSARKEGT